MKTRTYSKREIERILSNNGWILARQTGSHKIYTHPNGNHLTVRCKQQNKMIMRRLIRENELIVD